MLKGEVDARYAEKTIRRCFQAWHKKSEEHEDALWQLEGSRPAYAEKLRRKAFRLWARRAYVSSAAAWFWEQMQHRTFVACFNILFAAADVYRAKLAGAVSCRRRLLLQRCMYAWRYMFLPVQIKKRAVLHYQQTELTRHFVRRSMKQVRTTLQNYHSLYS